MLKSELSVEKLQPALSLICFPAESGNCKKWQVTFVFIVEPSTLFPFL